MPGQMAGRTVLVTGGTHGIGKATATGLATLGAEDPGRIQRMITPFMGLMEPPEQGALTPIHLASAPEVEGVTGQFSANRKPRRSSVRW